MAVRTRKPATKRKQTPDGARTQASTQAKKQMWAVVLFAAGLLIGALTFIKGDKLWLVLHNFLFGMFGWSAFLMAPLTIYIAVIAAMDRPVSTIRNKLWQAFALIVMISGAIQIFGEPLFGRGTLTESVKSLYREGAALDGGGVIGGMFAFPLLSLFDKLGASIITILCIFVFAMLVTGSTLIGLFKSASKPVRNLEGAYAAASENREQRRRERKAPAPEPVVNTVEQPARFDINVDISGDTEPGECDKVPWDEEPHAPEMPVHPVTSQRPEPREKPAGLAESPVEYISPEEFKRSPRSGTPEPEAGPVEEKPPEPARRHSLDDDILRAERETDDELDGIIERFAGMGAESRAGNRIGYTEDGYAFSAESEAEVANAPIPPTIPAFADPPLENRPPYVYPRPPADLLKLTRSVNDEDAREEMKQSAQTLVDTLNSFGVQTRVTEICRGPAVTRYELQPSAGVKISKITGLADDIALNLASAGIRIEAPIPNKAAVGIEVPNKRVSVVSIRELIDSPDFQTAESNLSVALGRDIAGNVVLADIARMPHLLIAGSTGSGKSVCINSIIISLLYKSSPEDVKLLMVDPKMVELGIYNGIPHLLVPVVTDSKKAAGALNWAVAEMERRYREFADRSVRDLVSYNRFARANGELESMPQIVIVIDELADLMMVASKEVEEYICRLAQKARAAGMHLVIATQRPSVDVITGLIKANIPSRVAFLVSSMVDSRTILDMGGAEKLIGRGDMLFYPMGASKPQRVQGCFVTDPEVESVVEYIKAGEMAKYDQQIVEEIDRHVIPEKSDQDDGGFADFDEMLPQAIECVIDAGQASSSLLQRRLKVGYARAGRIIDQMEERGIVGPFEGSKPRQILISRERWLEMKLSGNEDFSGKPDKPVQEQENEK